MSVVFTGTNQGRFVANGSAVFIPLPSGADYCHILNETQAYSGAVDVDTGVIFDWYGGDAIGRGTVQYITEDAPTVLNISQIAAGSGFYFINTTNTNPGPLNNGSTGISNITDGTPPLVTVGSTAGMFTGQTVQLYDVAGVADSNAFQLSGLQFTITIDSGTEFYLTNCSPLAAGGAATGNFRVIPYFPLYIAPTTPGVTALTLAQDPYWYPTTRVIGNISQAAQAIITLLVTHSYTVGQSISLRVPTITATEFGMPQLNNLQDVTIVAINQADENGYTNTITVDVDTTQTGPFAFVTASTVPYTPALVVPSGENTAQAINSGQNILADSTVNQSQFGLLLVAGALSPAGQDNDVIQWVAGKSFNGF